MNDEFESTEATWAATAMPSSEGRVAEGLVVLSQSGAIEGRTTGARLPCSSIGCPGWFIGVSWETGQRFRPCSEGWHYDENTQIVRITGGGEISARVVSPAPLGTAPRQQSDWPARRELLGKKGWFAGDVAVNRERDINEWNTTEFDRNDANDVLNALDSFRALRPWAWSNAELVTVIALPPWLTTWLGDRGASDHGYATLASRWNPLAPESWRLRMRATWSPGTPDQEPVERDIGWAHPNIDPARWAELTERIWARKPNKTTVTSAVQAML